MTPAAAFVAKLREAADAARVEETAYRRDAAARIAGLEQERAFAFRRFNLLASIAEAVHPDPEASGGDDNTVGEEIAVARAQGVIRARLGWSSDSESRSEVLTRFAPVAAAMVHASTAAVIAEPTEATEALAAFECWYEETYKVSFWRLFEIEIPDSPVVDF